MSAPGFALIGGGVRSGKSAFALRLAMAHGGRRVFFATAVAFDDEMRVRIARHVEERAADFTTIEATHDLDLAVGRLCTQPPAADVVVIDCLTLWLSNLLLADDSHEAIERRVDGLAGTLAAAPFHTLLVTNEVGMGIVPETALGRAFRDISGRAHQRLARSAQELYLAALGTVLRLRPGPVQLVFPEAEGEGDRP
ncbi:bifunctional adenosylcobinamide kinase/adenosylcobinamide-phosphate guanylyltransferase [Pendulispora albinea]|uniref:Adenosylcobinamide kinase n=1 Tax=Pendulispora albinea TaxID=2741071 RepID=A0ABZ2M246_9BACT